MGCQNSKLNEVDNNQPHQKEDVKDQKRNQKLKSNSREEMYKQKENQGVQNLKGKGQNKQGMSINIVGKNQLQSGLKQLEREKLREDNKKIFKMVFGKLEELQKIQSKKRKQKYSQIKTRKQYEQYFNAILQLLKKKNNLMKDVFADLEKKLSKQQKSLLQNLDIEKTVHGYLNDQRINLNEVKVWMKEKIVTANRQGHNLTKQLNQVCKNWSNDKEYIAQILSIAIEDRSVPHERSFLLSMAYDYEFQHLLDEKSHWQECLTPLYMQLQSLLS